MMATIRDVFSRGGSRHREDALQELATAIGFQRLGSRIREALDNDLRTAVRRGLLRNESGQLSLATRSIGDYTLDQLVAALLTAMGSGWTPRTDAVTAAARALGFRRTGSQITTAFKSALNAAIRRQLIERDGPERIRRQS